MIAGFLNHQEYVRDLFSNPFSDRTNDGYPWHGQWWHSNLFITKTPWISTFWTHGEPQYMYTKPIANATKPMRWCSVFLLIYLLYRGPFRKFPIFGKDNFTKHPFLRAFAVTPYTLRTMLPFGDVIPNKSVSASWIPGVPHSAITLPKNKHGTMKMRGFLEKWDFEWKPPFMGTIWSMLDFGGERYLRLGRIASCCLWLFCCFKFDLGCFPPRILDGPWLELDYMTCCSPSRTKPEWVYFAQLPCVFLFGVSLKTTVFLVFLNPILAQRTQTIGVWQCGAAEFVAQDSRRSVGSSDLEVAGRPWRHGVWQNRLDLIQWLQEVNLVQGF